jgi:YVTN family beta-propeller protein
MKRLVLSTLALATSTMLSASPFAYVTNYDAQTVGIFDLATNAMTGYVSNPNNYNLSNPDFVLFTPDGTKAYLLADSANAVYVINVSTNTITSQIASSFDLPYTLAFTPDGTKAYVTNLLGNYVSIIDVATDTVTGFVDAGGFPFNFPTAVVFSPDGSTAYVNNFNGNVVSMIDVATDTVRGYVCTICTNFDNPFLAAFASNTLAYVSAQSSSAVYGIDVANSILSGQINVGSFPFSYPGDIAITSDGATALISNEGTGLISVVDVSTNTTTGYVTGASFFARFLAISPDNSTAYAASFNTNAVYIIDISTATVTGTVNTSVFPLDFPYSIAIQP